MPLTLAIDCAMRRINLGLGLDGALLGCESLNTGAKQGDVLPLIVEEFAARLGHRLSDVGRVAVTVGPGYYTGIRVGLSYAAALAESLGADVFPITTLRAMAYGFLETPPPSLLVVPLIRARADAVYAAAYRAGRQVMEESFLDTSAFLERIAALSTTTDTPLFLGEDAKQMPEILRRGVALMPAAHFVGRNMIAAAADAGGLSAIDPTKIRARYLRNPD